MARQKIDGILVLYHLHLVKKAPTILEHINAFQKHSRFHVWNVNTKLGFPGRLDELEFSVIILHYSLFGWRPFRLNARFRQYLSECHGSRKVAFFQDEFRHWPERIAVIKECGIDQVYTLFDPAQFRDTYWKFLSDLDLKYSLPGYVSDDLVKIGKEKTKPESQRTIDVGYRGRQLPYYLGRGSQEKDWIGSEFKRRAEDTGLILDLESEEGKRIYGDDWYEFLSNCRTVLGVETGVSIVDIDDVVLPQYTELMLKNPKASFEEVYQQILAPHEDKIPYRTIGPRHFECASLRVCQILFEGKYSGIMEPLVHYIPLKKDFSNFDDVIQMAQDEGQRKRLTDNAYRDLIESGIYSYRTFVEEFDDTLVSAGLSPEISEAQIRSVDDVFNHGRLLRTMRARAGSLIYSDFPGKRQVLDLTRPLFMKYLGWEV